MNSICGKKVLKIIKFFTGENYKEFYYHVLKKLRENEYTVCYEAIRTVKMCLAYYAGLHSFYHNIILTNEYHEEKIKNNFIIFFFYNNEFITFDNSIKTLEIRYKIYYIGFKIYTIKSKKESELLSNEKVIIINPDEDIIEHIRTIGIPTFKR